ncbi:restriction endonuclease subunit S [Nostoc sp. C052]|uniref:restriction endonuclease subunit S n=1 Tax=Nostoc sp. C052 TaxID=2576902 RepID=UPI0015C40C26|nr:restriction endonuclease subunit S [Nostoc sp. C052]
MKLESFFENFELLTDAPNTGEKLREIILQLAPQGKLVPQNPNHEPASILLQRIDVERKKLINEGKLKEIKLPIITQSDSPYLLPSGWEWVRLGNVVTFIGGSQPPKNKFVFEEREGYTRLIQIRDYKTDNFKTYVPNEFVNRPCNQEDVMIGRYGPPVFQILRGLTGTYNVALMKAEPIESSVTRDYLFYLLQEPRIQKVVVYESERTAGQTGVRKELLNSFIVGLPPLIEQSLIVAKVKQLTVLCEEIEKRQQQRQKSIVRMNESVIAQLLSSKNPDEFRQHWQRICNNFDLLYSIPETIPKLRQAILQLAVQGKLVRQNISDGWGLVLLQEIAIYKETLIKEGKIKRALLSPIAKNDIDFNIPDNWIWTRFGEVILDIEAGASPLCDMRPKIDEEWGVIKISAVSWDKYNPNENKALPIGVEPKKEYEIKAGDFLMSRANTNLLVGKSVIVEDTPPRLLINDKTLRVSFPNLVDKRFFNLYNNSLIARKYYAGQGTGTSNSMKNITREQIRNLPVPLPPLAEQKRIVEKCDRLMSLCDTLEAKLKQGRDSSEKLMEVGAKQVLTA